MSDFILVRNMVRRAEFGLLPHQNFQRKVGIFLNNQRKY